MKKYLMLSTFLPFYTLAFLSVSIKQDQTPHNFETLKLFFQQPSNQTPILNYDLLKNTIWSGRCFSNSEPNKAVNAGYQFRQKSKKILNFFNIPINEFEAVSYWMPEEPANYYDNLSKEYIKAFDFKPIRTVNNLSIVSFNEEQVSVLKSFKNFILEEVIKVETDEVVGRCYYFKVNQD